MQSARKSGRRPGGNGRLTMAKDDEIKRWCVRQAKKECAYCIDGKCFDPDLLFRDGQTDEPPCFAVTAKYSIADGGIACDWFLLNVLPLDKELNRLVWAEINKTAPCLYDMDEPPSTENKGKACALCGKPFIPSSNRQRYCTACAKERERKATAQRMREYRARN